MYAMSYFRTKSEALHLAISEDGFRWTALNNNEPILRPTDQDCTVRDPHISRDRNGLFHLFFTGGWSGNGIMHCTSPDLVHWGEQEFVPVMANIPGTRNCWAPECFYDQDHDLYRIFWSSTVNNDDTLDWKEAGVWNRLHDHRIWGTTTRDFKQYTPAAIFFDPCYSIIDATLAYHDSEYLMAFKDERGVNDVRTNMGGKCIHICIAPTATGSWLEISTPLTAALTEGPCLFRCDGKWMMFYDHHGEHFYGAATSNDGRVWTIITEQIMFPSGPRHASVLEVDAQDPVSIQLRSMASGG